MGKSLEPSRGKKVVAGQGPSAGDGDQCWQCGGTRDRKPTGLGCGM